MSYTMDLLFCCGGGDGLKTEAHYITVQAGLKLSIVLSQPLEHRDCKYMLPHKAYKMDLTD